MKIIKEKIFDGKNIYSNKKVIRLDFDFEGYSKITNKDILNFNNNFIGVIAQIKKYKNNIIFNDKVPVDLKGIHSYLLNELESKFNLNNKVKMKKISKEIYYVIIEYEYKNSTLEIWKLAIDLINNLLDNKVADIESKLKDIEKLKLKEAIDPNVKVIINKAIKKNMPFIALNESSFYQIGYGKSGRIFNGVLGEMINGVALKLSYDKLLLDETLKNHYIPTVKKKKIENITQLLEIANEIGYPLVLKNQYENNKKITISNIENEKNLLRHYKNCCKQDENLILEKHIEGKSFRVCIVDYKVVGVALRIRPCIVGNEKKNVKELIQELNKDEKRGENSNKPFNKIKIDEELLNCIERQGLNINSIPVKKEKVYLRENANILKGGVSEDYTEYLSQENKEICENVAKVLNLGICGIDIITEDISKPINKIGAITDVVSNPNIIIHEFPYVGENRDVSGAILNMMYENYIKNIPIVSILGEGNEEVIIKGINYVLSKMGYVVGAKTKDMLIINNKYITKGEVKDSVNSKSVLLNKEVDIGILNSTMEEVISRGLDYELCDVGIITSKNVLNQEITECFNAIDRLFLNSIKDDGYVIVNAEEDINFKEINKIKAKKIFFSTNPENEILKENMEKGDPVVYIDNEIIYVEANKKKYMICKLKDIPLISNNIFKNNIENVIVICAGLVGLKVDYCMIAKGLKNFDNELN